MRDKARMTPPNPLPPQGRLKLLAPPQIERCEHDDSELFGIGLDSLGRVSIAFRGEALRATLTPAQLVQLGLLLLAAAEQLEENAQGAAARAAEQLAAIAAAGPVGHA